MRATCPDDRLLPCPFCGSKANICFENGEYWVKCQKKGVCFGKVHARIGGEVGFANRDDAIRLWNERSDGAMQFFEASAAMKEAYKEGVRDGSRKAAEQLAETQAELLKMFEKIQSLTQSLTLALGASLYPK